MIDDDSNELIPSDGGGDNDENAEDGNADDVQSVSIIQDEQGITFLGDAGVIDLWLKSEGSIPRRSRPKLCRPSRWRARAHRRPAMPWSKAGAG